MCLQQEGVFITFNCSPFCPSSCFVVPTLSNFSLDWISMTWQVILCVFQKWNMIRGRQPSQAPDCWNDFPLLFRMNSGFDIPSSPKRVWLPLATFWISWHQSSTHFISYYWGMGVEWFKGAMAMCPTGTYWVRNGEQMIWRVKVESCVVISQQ